MQIRIIRAQERGLKDIGWLRSHFTFSFSSYYAPDRSGFGLLRVFNDDFVQPGGGFGLHPHTNMEIISIMLSGRMNHKDSMGYSEVVSKDWVQLMSAGSGLRHEEHNVGEEEVNFLQIWIEPKLQNIPPRYQRRHFPEERRPNQLCTVVSNQDGQAHCWINQDATISLGYFEAGRDVLLPAPGPTKSLFLFVISGSLRIGRETLQARDSVGIWAASEALTVHIPEETRFVLIQTPVNH